MGSSAQQPRLTPAEYARQVGVSRQAIHARADSGSITIGPDGKIDPQQADVEFAQRQAERKGGTDGDRLKQLQAEKLELQLAERRGELVARQEVDDEAFRCGRMLRDVVLGSVAKAAPILAAKLAVDQNLVRAHLDNIIRGILEELDRTQGEPVQ